MMYKKRNLKKWINDDAGWLNLEDTHYDRVEALMHYHLKNKINLNNNINKVIVECKAWPTFLHSLERMLEHYIYINVKMPHTLFVINIFRKIGKNIII